MVTMTYNALVGKTVEVAGWGISNSGEYPTQMETVSLKVLSHKECQKRSEKVDGLKFFFSEKLLITAANPYAQLACVSTSIN
jgi:hypothetical protein